jgi:hypothetical protein
MITREEFLGFVRAAVKDTGCTYSDAIVSFHEKNGLEIETISAWVKRDQELKELLRSEAISMKMVSA